VQSTGKPRIFKSIAEFNCCDKKLRYLIENEIVAAWSYTDLTAD